jgi:hypothetical protein
MSSLIDSEIARWFRFLSRWALLAGFVNLGLRDRHVCIWDSGMENNAGIRTPHRLVLS